METKHKAKWMVTATSPNKQLSVDARIRSVVSVTSAACLCCYKSGKKTTLKSSHSVMTTASSLQLLSFYWLNRRSCDCTHFLCMCLPAHPWRVVYEVIAPGSPPPPHLFICCCLSVQFVLLTLNTRNRKYSFWLPAACTNSALRASGVTLLAWPSAL